MGWNFSEIIINRNNKDNEDIRLILDFLNSKFKLDKKDIPINQFQEEKWKRGNEVLIGFYSKKNIIILDDEYDSISDEDLLNISSRLETEILRATNSDTVGVSMISIVKSGKLIRQKSFGLDYPYGEEEERDFDFGEKTKYEIMGSDAISVLESFKNSKKENEIGLLTIFKKQ